MKKTYRYCIAMLVAGMFSVAAFAQSVAITGNIRSNASKESLPAVSVTVKGGTAGTFTDSRGNFKLVTNHPLPLTIVITSIGFEQKEVEVASAGPVQVD